MWTRAELKAKAKFALKRNYWKAVLVAIIMALCFGGTGGSVSSDDVNIDSDSGSVSITDSFVEGFKEGYNSGRNDSVFEDDYYENSLDDDLDDLGDLFSGASAGILVIVVLVVVGIIFAIALLLTAFVFNPLGVGCARFFVKDLNEPATLNELTYAFDHSYMNVVKIMFMKQLKTFAWTLLFIVPGIIKAYEYRMIPYIVAENPEISYDDAFATTKRMMDGNKWNSFVLDLSFILWNLLSACTLGLLSVFFVGPYIRLTDAALYEKLSVLKNDPYQKGYYNGYNNGYQNNYNNGYQNNQNNYGNGYNNGYDNNYNNGYQNNQNNYGNGYNNGYDNNYNNGYQNNQNNYGNGYNNGYENNGFDNSVANVNNNAFDTNSNVNNSGFNTNNSEVSTDNSGFNTDSNQGFTNGFENRNYHDIGSENDDNQ